MTEFLHRYPGAQPFRDDDLSRRTFFGREPSSSALTDQILANRLVIVYAKSGMGKTSLLNAGIAPRLRDAGSLPLFVRVNDIQHGALSSVIESVRGEAERQEVEYVAGDTSSLWSFFKTVEFWRGDLLLSPVLIVDQFEELFTLQSPEEREKFLSELGYLLRGVPPPSHVPVETVASNTPPVIRVVLSLREDFLGLLEEASDQIPEIMDHRFRLAPLTPEMASNAITGPAAIEHEEIATRAFRLEPECVTSILNYLTQSTAGARGITGRHVEPFHLQLICQRIETIAAFKQKTSSEEIVLGFEDIGGEAALAETLESFYTDAIRSLPRRVRRAVRKMCERFLISREGRRLSVEERELCRELNLQRETLRQLVDRRLLRTDRRSDSTYYELSHDALVQPVLASRRTQAFLLYWTAICAGSLAFLSGAALVLFCIIAVVTEKSPDSSLYLGAAMVIVVAVVMGAVGIVWLRSGIRRRSRYGQHRLQDVTETAPKRVPRWRKALGWTMLVMGPAFFLVWGAAGLVGLVQYSAVAIRHGDVPNGLVWMKGGVHEAWQVMHDHPFIETLWWIIEHSTIVLFGWLLFRQGDRMLWPQGFLTRSTSSPVPGVDRPSSLILALIKTLAGAMLLIVAVLGFFTLSTCNSSWHGSIPYWLSWPILSYRLSGACQTIYQKGWDWDEISFALFFVAALVASIVLLFRGLLDVRAILRFHRIAGQEKEYRNAWASVIACAIIVLLLPGWMWWRASSRKRPHSVQGSVIAASQAPRVSHLGWAVGNEATILHTEDDGVTWKSQSTGTGWFYSVTFSTRNAGWAVGPEGTIWHTSNGGDKWEVQTSGTKESLSVATFATPRMGWVVGNGGVILHTDDSGGTWTPQASGTTKGLAGVAFVTPQLGWAVGEGGTILNTEDGGKTWQAQKSGTSQDLFFVAFPTPQLGWAAGHDGTIVHTEDGGRTWNQQKSGTVRGLAGIAFATPLKGWVVGTMGTILHTDDGGRTWSQEDSGSRADVSEISFVTPQSGWAVSDAGVILHTDDGGMTWDPESSGVRTDLRSISFLKPYGVIGVELKEQAELRGQVVGSGPTLLHVTAGGPASKAGLAPGDVIVSVNGERVKTNADMVDAVYAQKPGTDAKVIYVHDGKDKTADIILGDGSVLSR